ncbi:hypothetical protein T440DRAFT_299649 [Plenodomus tracheiphilus IPT5]|uniref:Uncharacterized protein n=1 Tax=Plenodomus tracheiphilus IPT5 TaxID=1408161 RepID=A0A6A7ARU4_9PLEO|nr:hypothetical protein T440DRAFT_299649 [Plenodomus tracheiphilus IPT5]
MLQHRSIGIAGTLCTLSIVTFPIYIHWITTSHSVQLRSVAAGWMNAVRASANSLSAEGHDRRLAMHSLQGHFHTLSKSCLCPYLAPRIRW